MNQLDRYTKLKAKADSLRREHDKAVGALEQVMQQLKDEHGCKTLKAAKKMLRELKVRKAELEEELQVQMDAFEEKWGDALDKADAEED